MQVWLLKQRGSRSLMLMCCWQTDSLKSVTTKLLKRR